MLLQIRQLISPMSQINQVVTTAMITNQQCFNVYHALPQTSHHSKYKVLNQPFKGNPECIVLQPQAHPQTLLDTSIARPTIQETMPTLPRFNSPYLQASNTVFIPTKCII